MLVKSCGWRLSKLERDLIHDQRLYVPRIQPTLQSVQSTVCELLRRDPVRQRYDTPGLLYVVRAGRVRRALSRGSSEWYRVWTVFPEVEVSTTSQKHKFGSLTDFHTCILHQTHHFTYILIITFVHLRHRSWLWSFFFCSLFLITCTRNRVYPHEQWKHLCKKQQKKVTVWHENCTKSGVCVYVCVFYKKKVLELAILRTNKQSMMKPGPPVQYLTW